MKNKKKTKVSVAYWEGKYWPKQKEKVFLNRATATRFAKGLRKKKDVSFVSLAKA